MGVIHRMLAAADSDLRLGTNLVLPVVKPFAKLQDMGFDGLRLTGLSGQVETVSCPLSSENWETESTCARPLVIYVHFGILHWMQISPDIECCHILLIITGHASK